MEERLDGRTALLAYVVAASNPFGKRNRRLSPEDFMPKRRMVVQPQPALRSKAMAFVKAFGGKPK